jgi:DNA-3-methyladenine glycosylase
VQAMGIHKAMNEWNIKDSDLKIISPDIQLSENQIITTNRIGITQGADLPYRYYLKDNIFVSKKG